MCSQGPQPACSAEWPSRRIAWGVIPLHGALSTLCSVASRLESVTEPRALQGYGTCCAQATSYWATAAVEFAFAADAVSGFPA